MSLFGRGGARLPGKSPSLGSATTTNFHVQLFRGTEAEAEEVANVASRSLWDNNYKVAHIDLYLRSSRITSQKMIQSRKGEASWFIGISYRKPFDLFVSLTGVRQVKIFKSDNIDTLVHLVNDFANNHPVEAASFREVDGVWVASVNYLS